MTVVAKGEGELTTLVSDGARPVVLEALTDYAEVTRDALAHEDGADERERLERRLQAFEELRLQIERTTGQAQLTGPEQLVAAVVRAAASIATHELDTVVSGLTAMPEPLDANGHADLRDRAALVTGCVDTLLACEGSRGE
jgi:hypothetical protein